MLRLAFIAALIIAFIEAAAGQPQPGPGPVPNQWTVSGSQISYPGCVLIPVGVLGGCLGNGTFNATALYQASVPVYTTVGGTVTGVIVVNINGGAVPSRLQGTTFQSISPNSTMTRFEGDSFQAGSHFSGVRYDGTPASPTAVQNGEEIASFNAWAYNGAAPVGPIASIHIYAGENIASGHQGSKVCLATTPTSSTSIADSICQQPSGGVTIGAASDLGAGGLNTIGAVNIGGALTWQGTAPSGTGTQLALTGAPAFTNPTSNTQSPGDNSSKLATTAFVATAVTSNGVSSFNTRTGAVVPAANDYTTAQLATNTTATQPTSGQLGHFQSAVNSTLVAFSASGAIINSATISLPAGQYICTGTMSIFWNTGVTLSSYQSAIGTNSGSFTGSQFGVVNEQTYTNSSGNLIGNIVPLAMSFWSLSTTTTLYIVTQANFSPNVGTSASSDGIINCWIRG